MKQYDVVEKHLEANKQARERKYKDAGLLDIMLNSGQFSAISIAVKQGLIPRTELITMLRTHASIDRCWRQVLEKRADLRGSDYGDKDELEGAKQLELGYNV